MPYSWVILGLLTFSGNAFAEPVNQNKSELESSRTIAIEFMQSLGSTLKKQIETEGVESAISVCKLVAPALSSKYSDENNSVKRVSLKPRNHTLGIADPWERKQLEAFDRAQQMQQDISNLEATTYEMLDGEKWFRYMKAIPVQAMCVKCHGKPEDIPANVKAKLMLEYPQDQGVGYAIGQIRGAISIRQKVTVSTIKE